MHDSVGGVVGGSSAPSQATATTPLSADAAAPVAGEVRADGLVFSVNPDGKTVSLSGWYGMKLAGEVFVPAEVRSGDDAFAVTRVGVPGADGTSAGVFAGSSVESVSVPASVADIVDGALSGCAALARVSVSNDNRTYASFDGMLFSKDLSSLLLVPEGKRGAAHIPDPANSVPAGALSRAPGLQSAEVGEGSAAFSSRNGILYTEDMKTLIACPPGAAGAVVLPEEVEAVAAGAFAGCEVSSIAALGFVREIAPDAFDEAVKSAVVALPAGHDYEDRKAVWEAAGFSEFVEPARPGDATGPTEPEGEGPEGEASGLAFTLLDDYTLSVAWTGSEDPAADLVIPANAELNGVSYRVTAVAPLAFEGCASLRSVKLPASVAAIGDGAFANCSNLESVELPEGLSAIGASAFESTALADLWFPASLQSVGPRVLAACASLQRIVALGSPESAPDSLAECAGVTVFCPAASVDSWNVGLPAAGNHLAPYGVELAETPLNLEVGQSANLFDEGELQAPEGVQTSYAYSAKPISVDQDGLVSAKAEGSSEVSVALSLDGVELARSSRLTEVIDPGQNASRQSGEGAVMPAATDSDLVFTKYEYYDPATQQTIEGYEVKAANILISGDLVIPSTYNGKPVLKVSYDGFNGCSGLDSITFAEGCRIIEFGKRAFANIFKDPAKQAEFVIPDSVATVGEIAFVNNYGLTKVVLGSKYSYFDESTFGACTNIKTIVVKGGYCSFKERAKDHDNPNMAVFPPVVRSTAKVMMLGGTVDGYDYDIRKNAWKVYGFTAENIQPIVNYSISFDGNGATGGSTASMSMMAGEPKSLAANGFVRSGYSFAGWSIAQDGSGSRYSDRQVVDGLSSIDGSTVVLHAQWSANKYSVTLNGNGATSAGTTSVTATYDASMPSITKPTRTGYLFAGYYDANAPSGGTQYYAADGKSARTWNKPTSATLYARWGIVAYSISYNLDGGAVSGNPTSYTVESGPIALKNPTKEGFTFMGWSGTGLSGNANKAVVIPKGSTENRSYFANWTVNRYAVTFEANGGEGTMGPQTFAYGTSQNLSANAFTRKGYDFLGWSTDKGAGTAQFADGENMLVSRDMTLYAVWKARSSEVVFETGGGSSIPPQEVALGEAATQPTDPKREGYSFVGWYMGAGGTGEKWDFSNPVTSNITLYARWTLLLSWSAPLEATVTVDASGNIVADEQVFQSSTAEDLRIVAVSSVAGEGASDAFEGPLSETSVTISLKDGKSFPLPLQGSLGESDLAGFVVPAMGSLRVAFGLEFSRWPKWLEGERAVSHVTYTVAADTPFHEDGARVAEG